MFVLACELTVRAEPISLTSVLVSLAISASLTAASIGLQMLMQPKAKPQDKNRLQGDIQLTHVGEDLPITEVYGASLGDGVGGIRLGGIIVYASQIRKVVVSTPGGGGGGGKGAPKAPPTKEHHYYIDLAVMVGRGPLRIKQIKAQNDIIYQGFTPTNHLTGVSYEAEDRDSDSGAVTEVGDADMSGNIKVNLDENEWIEWDAITAASVEAREIYVVYKSTDDIDIEFEVNGVTYDAVLPDSFGIRANVNLPKSLLASSSNVIRITNKTDAVLSLDRIVVGYDFIIDPRDPDGDGGGGGCYLSGVKYDNWQNKEPTYDAYSLRPVYARDDRGCEQWNYQANANANGEVSAAIVGNGNIRIYPGNKTQLPDPLLQEYFEARYGAGATPAYRGRCLVVFEDFEITKYGTVPNFTFVAEHETINSLGEMYASLAERAGLSDEEYDFTELEAVPVRGYAITEKRSPAKSMEILGRIFDVDVFEDFDGVIKGVIPDETVEVTIPADELDMQEGKDAATGDDRPFVPVRTSYRDESDIPYYLDVSYFDPSKEYETRNVHALREVESSDRKANIETGLVMTEVEAQKFAERDLHKQYIEKDGIEVSAPHKYSYLAPTQLIRVTDTDGATSKMRIKAMEGWIPGSLKLQGVSRDADEFPPRVFVVPNNNPVVPTVNPPAPIIGTFIDLAKFREEPTDGFYAAACLTDPHYAWAGAGLYREIEGDEWEALDGIQNESTMGLTATGTDGTLADVPGGWNPGDWDETNELTVDLYHGELETLTDDQVLIDGRNYLIVGDEIIQFGTATRDNGYPNRWIISHLQRGLKGTRAAASVHVESERAVLYTEAWRWIVQDTALANTERTYKFVASGGDLEKASSVDWTWNHNPPLIPILISAIFDSGDDEVTLTFTSNGSDGDIRILRRLGSAEFAEIAVVDFNAGTYIDAPEIDGDYTYRLIQDGVTGESNAITVEVDVSDAGTGTAPSGLTADFDDVDTVTLSWVNNGGTGNNIIERRSSLAGTFSQVGMESSSATSSTNIVPTGMPHGAFYIYRVRNVSAPGYSNEASVYVPKF